MTVTDSVPFFNPLEPGYIADPYPHLAEMRDHAPVQQTLAGPWAVFRHADVFRVLRDPTLSVDDANADIDDSERAALFDDLVAEFGISDDNHSILNTDPPDHTRLRRLVSKAFTPRAIEALRPRIQQLVDAALDRMARTGRADVVDELAFPLPFDVISEMLGMPEADKDLIRDWSGAMVKTLDPIISEAEARAAFAAARQMDQHIDQVIEWKRANPSDDLLTALIDVEDDGDRLSAIELRDQVVLLFIAGHETTVNLIGTGIHVLLGEPEQRERWRCDPSVEANAVDELLRYIAPVQFSRRIATADLEIDGVVIPEGSFVLTCLASANRDPAFWGPSADRLQLDREGAGQHVSFGSGAHYCLGASLAKLEGQLAIGSFIRRFPDATVVGEPEWNGRINLRGLETLIVDVA
ncbi:MAG: cytochrome P450 [Acidimicrobiia bacterium]|nr:cytochrome P450 [Acidimicrobiia bacterium]MDH5237994.1 cytochrome P450 [Acidimicrobiia bacterium]